jgi:hypothetical protein
MLPVDYLGLSFESSVLHSGLFDPAHSNLRSLLRDLGGGRLRFGGNSVDRVAEWTPDPGAALASWAQGRVTPDDLRQLGALSATTGWRIDLGLTLGHPDPAAAADEAATARRLIGPGLGTVEIGNEPDLFAPALRPGRYGYSDYLSEVNAYRASLTVTTPGIALAGPDTASPDWLAAYGHDEHAGLSFLTAHFYPLTRCGGNHPTIPQLLSAGTGRVEQHLVETVVAAARRDGLPVRIDETNSASCGGQDGVSNTLASALWMVNYLLSAGRDGVSGIDVHGGLAACRGYSPLCVPGATGPLAGSSPGIDPVADSSLGASTDSRGRLVVQPDFYSLLLVHQLEGGRWLPLHTDGSGRVTAFAVEMPDRSIRVVLDNMDGDVAANVALRLTGHPGTASVLRLTGPSLDATQNVSFGASEVGPDGTWHAATREHQTVSATGAHVDVGAASAVLLTLPPH